MGVERSENRPAQTEAQIRVLHVDDDHALATASAERLEQVDNRLDIVVETDAEQGLGRLDAVDCIVSDYQMPGMDGLAFLSAVRERSETLPFILFTGRGSEAVASEALSAGATDYLQKEVGSEQYEILANRIVNAVEGQRASERAATLERVQKLVGDIDQVLLRANTQSELEQRVCETLSTADPYRFAWIGGVDDDDHVQPRASAGIDAGYLDEVTITVDNSPAGQGPGGRALCQQRVVVTQNVHEDSRFEPWQEAAKKRDYRGVAAVPLVYGGRQYGLLVVYAGRTGAFTDSERRLLAELGDDIAHALDSLRTRRQLREERDRRAALFDAAPEPVVAGEIDEETGSCPITDVNAAFETVFDFEADTVIGDGVADVIVPDAERAAHDSFRRRVADGETVQAEVQRITADGPREFLLTAIPYGRDGPTPDGWYAWYTDISEQREREEILRRAHEVTGTTGVSFEKQVAQLLELGKEALGTDYAAFTRVGEDVASFEVVDVPPESNVVAKESGPASEMPFCAHVVETAKTLVHSGDRPAGMADDAPDVDRYLGAPVWVDDEVYGTFCFYDTDGTETDFSEWEASFVDLVSDWAGAEITRKQFQSELQRQNERLDEFASVVSHDLRNPLQVLETTFDLVAADADQSHIERCRRSVDRMQRLIDDLLALARGGEAVVTKAPVDVASVAEECWETVGTADATIETEANLVVRADSDKLRQLLENLLTNAVEHGSTGNQMQSDDTVEHGLTGDEDHVTVRVEALEDRPGFAVTDDGSGIPDGERERVFESGYSTQDHGTGFGLRIVEQVADLHGWDVAVTESDEGGARFEVTGVDPA